MFLRQPVHPEDFIVAPIIRYMPISYTTTCTGEVIEPLTHSVRSEATNHLVHQKSRFGIRNVGLMEQAVDTGACVAGACVASGRGALNVVDLPTGDFEVAAFSWVAVDLGTNTHVASATIGGNLLTIAFSLSSIHSTEDALVVSLRNSLLTMGLVRFSLGNGLVVDVALSGTFGFPGGVTTGSTARQ